MLVSVRVRPSFIFEGCAIYLKRWDLLQCGLFVPLILYIDISDFKSNAHIFRFRAQKFVKLVENNNIIKLVSQEYSINVLTRIYEGLTVEIIISRI